MGPRQHLLKHLRDAARLIQDDPEGFEDSLEELATMAHAEGNEADIMCSMLYAAGEALRNR